MTYQFLDSGNEQKLEQFGPYRLIRPAPAALWKPFLPREEWESADAAFSRDKGNGWLFRRKLPGEWVVSCHALQFKVMLTDFGHVGLFPEHLNHVPWLSKCIKEYKGTPSILNLFAYSGGLTLACAKAGAHVCHVDASKGMVSWARENAALNKLEKAPIRWIVDDVLKFLKREARRGSFYDGIMLDPPSYGRGSRGETFKIERDIGELLDCCRAALSNKPLFVLLSTHTPHMTPVALKTLLSSVMEEGECDASEMTLGEPPMPLGGYVRWKR